MNKATPIFEIQNEIEKLFYSDEFSELNAFNSVFVCFFRHSISSHLLRIFISHDN